MMGSKSKLFDMAKIKETFAGGKGPTVLMIIGLVGIALIALSSFWQSSGTKSGKTSGSASAISSDQYARQLGTRLESIVSKIDGVGRVQVMVTVESGIQYVYEQSQKTSNDTNQNTQQDGSTQTQENNDNEQDPIIVDNASGGQSPIIKTELEPAVKGVVVVCDGGDNPIVQESVTDAIMTALELPSNHISVCKRAKS